MSWANTYREYVNLPRTQLVSIAINNADTIMYSVAIGAGSNRVAKRMFATLFCGIACEDGTACYREYELYREITETLDDCTISYSEFCDIVSQSRGTRRSAIKDYYDMPYIKEAVVQLALCIAAIDDCISTIEQRVIEYFDEDY